MRRRLPTFTLRVARCFLIFHKIERRFDYRARLGTRRLLGRGSPVRANEDDHASPAKPLKATTTKDIDLDLNYLFFR